MPQAKEQIPAEPTLESALEELAVCEAATSNRGLVVSTIRGRGDLRSAAAIRDETPSFSS